MNDKLIEAFSNVLKAVYNVELTKQDITKIIDEQLKELNKSVTQLQYKELADLGKLYNGKRITFLNHYEERYKYLKNKLESFK